MSKIAQQTAIYTFKDRRQSVRRTVELEGKVWLPDGASLACVVLNVSAGGALIKPLTFGKLPDTFRLRIESCDFEAACEVRHRNLSTVGVMFMSSRRDALLKFG